MRLELRLGLFYRFVSSETKVSTQIFTQKFLPAGGQIDYKGGDNGTTGEEEDGPTGSDRERFVNDRGDKDVTTTTGQRSK